MVLSGILVLLGLISYSQTPVNDAISLAGYLDYTKNPVVFRNDQNSLIAVSEILLKYCEGLPDTTGYQDIIVAMRTNIAENPDYNPFIEPYLQVALQDANPEISAAGLTRQLAGSLGSLNVTNFADGLAKFLVERVKQELSTSFFEKFKQELERIKQLQIIFPATYNALLAIDKEIYNYAAYIDLLRESFQKDLTMLLPNIHRLIEDPCMDVVFSQIPEARIILTDAYYITSQFNEGIFPGEVLHKCIVNEADRDLLVKINSNLYPALQTLDLFSQSMRSYATDKYWIDNETMKVLFEPATFQIYIGLVYHQSVYNKIQLNDGSTLDALIRSHANKADSLIKIYKPYIKGLADRGGSIENYFFSIKSKQESGQDKPTYQDYYSLYDACYNFTEYLAMSPFMDIVLKESKQDSLNLQNYFRALRGLGNIYIDIYEKQYTSAIAEFSGMMNILFEKKVNQKIEELKNSTSSEITEDQKQRMLTTKQELTKMNDFIENIIKYGGFAASVAKAETSDDVKNAIEAAALPAGSSRIKRETPFNVSLNAYTGLFVGYEKIVEFDDEFALNSYGLTAPIGVAISHGCNHWSYSAFVSLIDLGTVAAFRFTTDSDTAGAQVPTIHLEDIFSPGVFLSVGIPKCPLSINLGAQVGPNLRKIYAEEDETGELIYQNQYEENVYWRFSISLLVDIPIFNFYTKSR
jgi:hypothetical protein